MTDSGTPKRRTRTASQPNDTRAYWLRKLNALTKWGSRCIKQSTPSPYCNQNTFFVWEPCTHSHAEVVPGYCKLLLDAGYEVSLFIEPRRIKEGLFSLFSNERLHINQLRNRATRKYFKNNGLSCSAGILVTTAGKLAKDSNYELAKTKLGPPRKDQKVLLVEHDIRNGADLGTISSDIITLRQVNYRNTITTPINPHYFGEIQEHCKSEQTVFAAVGALRGKRRNAELMIGAVEELHKKGISNFCILIIGKSDKEFIPRHLREYFIRLGRLSFAQLYQRVQCCDFLLPLLDPERPSHRRYITTGTSGTFQLGLGFKKPLIIEKTFAQINRLNTSNSVIYHGNNNFHVAMQEAISMTPKNYEIMRSAVEETARQVYSESLENLKSLL